MNVYAKALLYIVGAIIALTALITGIIYEWSNKDVQGENPLGLSSHIMHL